MTKYVHIVQVHPLENGEINVDTVVEEKEFDSWEKAQQWVNLFNYPITELRAFYCGRVNDATGELE